MGYKCSSRLIWVTFQPLRVSRRGGMYVGRVFSANPRSSVVDQYTKFVRQLRRLSFSEEWSKVIMSFIISEMHLTPHSAASISDHIQVLATNPFVTLCVESPKSIYR